MEIMTETQSVVVIFVTPLTEDYGKHRPRKLHNRVTGKMISPATAIQGDIIICCFTILGFGLFLINNRTPHKEIELTCFTTVLKMIEESGPSPKKFQTNWAVCVSIQIQSNGVLDTMFFEQMQIKLLQGIKSGHT